MTQNLETVLLALCETRSIGYITAALQLRMVNMDMNPEYIRRECVLWLDREEQLDVVPAGSTHIIDWAKAVIAEMEK